MPTGASQLPNGMSWMRRRFQSIERDVREMRARMASLTGIGNALEEKLALTGGTLTGPLTVEGGFDVDLTGVVTLNALVFPPEVTTFSRTAVITPAVTGSWVVWRAPKACRIVAVRGYRDGGTGATINAERGTADILATNLSLVTNASWLSESSVQNDVFDVGDSLTLEIRSVAGSPAAITIQVDLQEA